LFREFFFNPIDYNDLNWSVTSATLAATCRATGAVKKTSLCAFEKQHHYFENEDKTVPINNSLDPFIQCRAVASDSRVNEKTGHCSSQMAKKRNRRLLERQVNKWGDAR